MDTVSISRTALPEVSCSSCHLLTPRWRAFCIHCHRRLLEASGMEAQQAICPDRQSRNTQPQHVRRLVI